MDLNMESVLFISVCVISCIFVFSGCVSWWCDINGYEMDRRLFEDGLKK